MRNLHLLPLFLFVLCSCDTQKQQSQDGTLAIFFGQVKDTASAHIFETVFIKLETNEECLVDKTITQVEFESDKFFVLSGRNERHEGVIPVYDLTFTKHTLPPMEYLQKFSANNANFIPELNASGYISNYSVFDACETLCVYYYVAQTPYIGVYDKETKIASSYTLVAFQDNLQTGYIDRISGATDQYVIAVLQPFELSERLTQSYVFSKNLQPLIEESLSDDNPILCLFRTKIIR